MKKVLILVNHDVAIYNTRRELVEQLLADGYEVMISSPYGERIDDLIAMGCKYLEISMKRHGTNIFEEMALLRRYFKLIDELKPDVVLTYNTKPNIYGGLACRIKKVPYIANITGLGTAVAGEGIIKDIMVRLYRSAFKTVSCVFFQNDDNLRFLLDKIIAVKKYRLLPGSGVNLDYFHPLDYPGDDTVEFLFISRIMKEKGIDLYLEAARYIREKYPNTVFHICGFCEEAYEDKLHDMQERGIIVYHGMVRDVRSVLSRVHCIVHPSFYPEGLSNALLEGAASARPIITTDRAGCREVVDDGVNGYLFKKRSADELIDRIERFISLPYEEKKNMGIEGRKKVQAGFDRRIVVEKYREELLRICWGESI